MSTPLDYSLYEALSPGVGANEGALGRRRRPAARPVASLTCRNRLTNKCAPRALSPDDVDDDGGGGSFGYISLSRSLGDLTTTELAPRSISLTLSRSLALYSRTLNPEWRVANLSPPRAFSLGELVVVVVVVVVLSRSLFFVLLALFTPTRETTDFKALAPVGEIFEFVCVCIL